MIPAIFWMVSSIETGDGEVSERKEPEEWTAGLSLAMHVFLPVAGLALLWGQRGILSRLLLQLDRSCISVYCPSISKREKLLRWASERLPTTWSSQARTLSAGIPELWKDGSLLCTLINSVVPGACPNPHRHWRKPPLHAQALAYKYLGLVPKFTDDELSGDLSITQERNFIHYLQELQQAINQWSKDDSARRYSYQYVARGMGLYTGEQYRKAVFYVYSDAASKRRGDLLMHIRGPYGTQGSATIPPFHSLKTIPVVSALQDQLHTTKILSARNREQTSFLKTISLDFTSLISNVQNHASIGDIPIEVEMEIDRAKVSYIPRNTGMYEINIISDGELLRGSPYNVRVVSAIYAIPAETEKVTEKMILTRRKVISKVIDCIDETIVLDQEPNLKDNLWITAPIPDSGGEAFKAEFTCVLEEVPEDAQTYLDIQKQTIIEEPILSLQIDTVVQNFYNNTDPEPKPETPIVLEAIDENASAFKEEDENNNSASRPQLKRITSEMYIEINPNSTTTSDTSPICPDHIVPEVETPYQQLSLSEKRRIFSEEASVALPERESLSEASEDGVDSRSQDSCFKELSVMNILETIRQSRNNSLSEQDSLLLTVSLPNINQTSEITNHERTFKARRDYWERMSSKSSSNASLANSDYSHQSKRSAVEMKNLFNKFNSVERVWKFEEKPRRNIAKSTSDISVLSFEAPPSLNIKKYKSFDDSLEDCSVLSIEERKKILLKKMCDEEKERPVLRKITIKEKQIAELQPTPRIQQEIEVIKEVLREVPAKVGTKHVIKSQFKKAIQFFKNLESSPVKKSKPKKEQVQRRYSLEFATKNNQQRKKRGGSLNLPNVSERFSVNNLYDDVFGSRDGSFRGTPNKSAIANVFASFERSSLGLKTQGDVNDDNISYHMFINKSKTKKRRSIKNLFDVNY